MKDSQNFELAPKIEQSASSTELNKHEIYDNGLAKYQNNIAATNDKENGTYNQVLKPGDKRSSMKGKTNSSAVDEMTRM